MLPKDLNKYKVKTAKSNLIKTTFRIDKEAYELVKNEFKVNELVNDVIVELANKIKKEKQKEAKKTAQPTPTTQQNPTLKHNLNSSLV